jgi:PAS domain S-box-containing protein
MADAVKGVFFPADILLDRMLELTPDHVYFKDRKSRFVRTSAQHARWLGCPDEEQLWGKTDFDFFSTEHSTQAFSDEQQIMETGKPMLDYEEKETFEDGSERWVKTSKWPLLNASGQIIGTFGISHDITDKKEVEKQLRIKQVFMADMSHEIRTPMNAIMGLSKLLRESELDDTQREYINTIVQSGENLLVILNDILDLSRIESGKLRFEKIGISLPEIMSNAVTVFKQKAREKNIRLDFHIESTLARVHLSDPIRISQILINLVSNAIKFTHNGYVEVTCSLIGRQKNNELVQINVTDTGIGIADTSRIFESFEQETKSTTRHYGGTGLGLSICQKLVQLLSGSIVVHSMPGAGTVFQVVLPLEVGEESDLVAAGKAAPESGAVAIEDVRVLVVDDVSLNTFVVKQMLKGTGATLMQVSGGKEAIEMLRTERFDIILMDMQMPGMDGLETTRIIRKELRLATPIIALTASAQSGEDTKCRAAGMDDFLLKPFEKAVLLQKIAALISFNVASDTGQAFELPQALPDDDFSLEQVLRLSAGDHHIRQELLSKITNSTHTLLNDIRGSAARQQWPELRRSAHGLKSAVNFLSVKAAQPLLLDLEAGRHESDISRLNEAVSNLEAILLGVLKKINRATL